MHDSKQLRQQMQKHRLALPETQQQKAAEGLLQVISKSTILQNVELIAFYPANRGEIDPLPVIEKAWSLGKKCYLPVLQANGENSLMFAPYSQESTFEKNRYGIPEPAHSEDQLINGEQLDLALIPLVAIDARGNRIGMGKGYYDRTFSFLQDSPRPAAPKLIGLAHSFQQVERIEANPWDVALDGLANERSLISFT